MSDPTPSFQQMKSAPVTPRCVQVTDTSGSEHIQQKHALPIGGHAQLTHLQISQSSDPGARVAPVLPVDQFHQLPVDDRAGDGGQVTPRESFLAEELRCRNQGLSTHLKAERCSGVPMDTSADSALRGSLKNW